MQENIKSYNSIYQLREAFLRSGGHSDTFADEFNRLETPARLYFRIFFHFNTGHGLLNTGNQYIDPDPERVAYTENTNTAVSYLFTNGEHQRRQMLDDFVTLLSNINTYSPWYFQSIEGLQEALQRPEYTGEFKIDEEPRSITIKTLEDAYDNRISTLLDLYKAVAFSKIQRKEILPANLRRFDMSIYIINTPLAYVHYGYGLNPNTLTKRTLGLDGRSARPLAESNFDEVSFEIPNYREWVDGSSQIFSSAKLIEFQGCEIDANSAASAYTEVKSDEPFGMSHEIKITFQDVMEQRYNDTLNRIIGDCIFMDMDQADRESKDNVWGVGSYSRYSSADIVNTKMAAAQAAMDYEEDPYERDEEGNILGEKIDPSESFAESLGFMEESNARAYDNSIDASNVEGKLTGASGVMINDNYEKNKNIDNKYGAIGNIAQGFLRGAADSVKNYIGSAVTKLTMGNLYWGSLSNPQATFNPGKLGANLMQQGLDNTVGKSVSRGLGSVKSSLNNAKAAARGWITGSSIGSNMSGGSSRHRP